MGGSSGGGSPADRGRGGHDDARVEHDRVPADQERRPASASCREELPDPRVGRGRLPLGAVGSGGGRLTMAKTRIGVDVGSTAVRVAEVAAGDVPVVVRGAQVQLGPGIVEAGEVRQPEAVAEALREVWSKAGLETKQAYLGVGNQRVVVREVVLPWLPEKDLREDRTSVV